MTKLGSLFKVNVAASTWELRIKRPLSMATTAAMIGLADTAGFWFIPIIRHYKEKANVRYEPLLEIMKTKAQELSGLIKELEALAIYSASPPVPKT
jgi:hypothetical protein